MQSFKLIKVPNLGSEEPKHIPHTSRAGMLGQRFYLFNYSNTPSEKQIKLLALASGFLLILGQRAPLLTVTHSQRLKKFNHWLPCLLKNQPWQQMGMLCP